MENLLVSTQNFINLLLFAHNYPNLENDLTYREYTIIGMDGGSNNVLEHFTIGSSDFYKESLLKAVSKYKGNNIPFDRTEILLALNQIQYINNNFYEGDIEKILIEVFGENQGKHFIGKGVASNFNKNVLHLTYGNIEKLLKEFNVLRVLEEM